MANENVKIIVQEVDETRPLGSGASSDIVYVPGLGNDFVSAENRNVPILCSSVEEFEFYFGTTPYKFMKDGTYSNVSVKAKSYDRSYIYAKELLNAGLSVLYEAISDDTNLVSNVGNFASTSIVKQQNTRNVFQTTKKGEATVTFGLDGYPAYGCMSLFLVNGTGSLVELQSVSCNNSKFDIVASAQAEGDTTNFDRTFKITWGVDTSKGDVTAQDIASVVFTAKLLVDGEGLFAMNLVEGDMSKPVTTDGGDHPLKYFYDHLLSRLDNLKDKNEYTVKYITTGAYPSFVTITETQGTGKSRTVSVDYPFAAKLLEVAANRNDAVALIDHADNPAAALGIDQDGSFYKAANDYFATAANAEFGAMFTPWGDYTCTTVNDATATLQAMPASFGYLLCLAYAIKTSPNWLAMAGVTRGIVPGLKKLRTDKVLSNVIAENYQPKYGDVDGKNVVSVNAITNVKPYGLTIWGNRTLKKVNSKGTVATNFLNIRNMLSDIKKLAYNTAKSLMFEQDSDTLWLSFKSGVSPLLDQLKSGYGISDYKLIRSDKKYNGSALTRGEMAAVIKIFPLYAVEYFEITVVVADNDVAIS